MFAVERWVPCLKWIAPVGVIAGLAVLYCFPVDRYPIYPRCIFHELTGLDCPGCGSLRSVQCLLHGDIAAAFRFNPLLYLLIPALVVCRRHLHKPAWVWSLVAVVVVFTIARNL